jgi:nucleoside-diphosphate-sugar epimerase
VKRALVTGYAGFIGTHLVKLLKREGYWVRGVDIKYPEFEAPLVDDVVQRDLRTAIGNKNIFEDVDEVYHLAADMGGIGFIETHKSEIVLNNTLINMNVLKSMRKDKKFFFSSSACIYPGYLQKKVDVKPLKEEDAYPADSEDGYGWEKLMMERTCRHFMEDYGLQTYVARFHNIYGPLGTYKGGREKSPAALCRKIALAKKKDSIEVWGDGKQTRSYCYVTDCVEGIYKLTQSNHHEPINLGSDRLVSINELIDIIAKIAGKKITNKYDLTKPQGVKGRNADITKVKEILKWKPKVELEQGLKETYQWIQKELSL